mgnify:CR=1 FL=1
MGKNNEADRVAKAKAEVRAKQLNEMPMNKEFLQAKDEAGNLKYPIVDQLVRYKLMDLERIEDHMRHISAYVAQVRHHQNRIKRLEPQLTGVVLEKDEHGRTLTHEEVQLLIVSEKIAIPRDISKIREHAVDKLLPLVNGQTFTGEMYNEFILKIAGSVEKLGYRLFPEKITLIFPEF